MSSSGGGVIIVHNSAPRPPVHLTNDQILAIIANMPDGEVKDALLALID